MHKMLIEAIIALAGSIVGILAGLLPGVHTNLLAVIIAGFNADVWLSSVFLVAVAVSRSVIDAVPTIFLGASEDVMALLPGHHLLKKGCGIEAVKFCVLGSILGIIGGVLLIPLFIVIFPFLFSAIHPYLFWLLLIFIFILLLRDGWKSFVVFILAGLLGILALNSVREPLFPLLSGLFGASGLLLSIFNKVKIPEQVDTDILRLRKMPLFLSAATGILAGSIVTLFPGMSPSQAAALAQIKRMKSVRYLVLTGALGTVDVVISLVTLFVLGKARNGAVVVIEQLLGVVPASALTTFVAVACAAAGLSAVIALFASKWFAILIEKIDYSFISSAVFFFLLLMSLVLSGWLGVLIFITATAVGLIAPLTNVSRSHSMGCLLLPTLILLSPIAL
jgi:putative membrane protein